MRAVTLSLLLVLVVSGAFGQQGFSVEPQDELVAPGHNTTLTCLVDNMVGECRWQKEGKPVGLFPGKYSVAMVKGDCSLTISNVDLKIDDGEWECQVTSSSFSSGDALASRKARLTVQDPVSMTSVIAVVIALLIVFLVLVISLLIAYKKQKLCFQDSEKEKEAEGGGFGPGAYINGSAGSKLSLTKDVGNGMLPSSSPGGHYLAPSTKV